MKEILKRLKKDKLLIQFFIPLIFVLTLIISFFLFEWSENNFINWMEFTGLILLTLGAIFALRPVIRSLLNPKIKSLKNIERRNINAGVISFALIMGGFTMQLISKFYIIFPKNFLPSWSFTWLIISLAVIIINYFLLFRVLKQLKYH